MTNRFLLFGGLFCLLLWNCKPEPIHTELAGYSIRFPITAYAPSKEYPDSYTSGYSKFVDSTQTVKAEWPFNAWGNRRNHDPANTPFGVVIFLKNKSSQFDSVKTALEQRYRKELRG